MKIELIDRKFDQDFDFVKVECPDCGSSQHQVMDYFMTINGTGVEMLCRNCMASFNVLPDEKQKK